jgi:ABC-type multidrug transport system ATPase subunit
MDSVTTRELSKRYATHTALHGVNLNVPSGSVYALLGPNGAGKTTTLKVLTGLVRATSGEVWLEGRPVADPASRAALGALIESPALYAHLSGPEHLRVYARDRRATPARQREVLEIVGLSGVGTRRTGQYSLGMRQRLGIALALLGDPAVLILDEPQNGLDPQGIAAMRGLLAELHARGLTLIVSSHLLHEVEQIATHVGVMAAGRLVFEDRMDALLRGAGGRVLVEVDDVARAAQVLRSLDPALRTEGATLELGADPALVARQLVQAGVGLRRLVPAEDTLEERYFHLIQHGTDAASGVPGGPPDPVAELERPGPLRLGSQGRPPAVRA